MRIDVQDPAAWPWRVERRWWPGLGSMAKAYARWYRRRKARPVKVGDRTEGSGGGGFDPSDLLVLDDLVGFVIGLVIVVVVGLLVIVFGGWLFLPFAVLGDLLVTLPMLLVVPALRACRVLPFVVTARTTDDEPAMTWRVRGVRRSAEAAHDVAAIIRTGGTPPMDVAELLRGVQD